MQVSEWRHGEVGLDPDGSVVIKPLTGQGSSATAPGAAGQTHAEEEVHNGVDEEEEEEGV